MNDGSENLKAYFTPLARAMADFSEGPVRAAMDALFEEDAILRICHPFGELVGPNAFYKTAYAPLLKAMPDLERRELILLAGKTPEGQTGLVQWAITWGRFWLHFWTSRRQVTWRICAITSSFASMMAKL